VTSAFASTRRGGLGRLELLDRQRPQYPHLRSERFAHALVAAGDPPLELGEAAVLEQIVELFQRADLRHRDEITAAEAAHLALDATLFVGTLTASTRERRFEQVVRAQRNLHDRLAPVDLRLDTGLVHLRHEHLVDRLAQLAPADAHIAAHLPLRNLDTMLVDEPLPDPPRNMPLLTRRLPINDHHPSISSRYGPSFGAGRPTGCLRGGGNGEASACRTVRRCTPWRRAKSRIDSPSRSRSLRICSNCSTLDPIPSATSRSSSEKPERSSHDRTEVGQIKRPKRGQIKSPKRLTPRLGRSGVVQVSFPPLVHACS
jgi:hypothetical protein